MPRPGSYGETQGVTGEEPAVKRGGMMNYNVKQGVPGPLARIARRVAAIVTECNDAQARLASSRNTAARF